MVKILVLLQGGTLFGAITKKGKWVRSKSATLKVPWDNIREHVGQLPIRMFGYTPQHFLKSKFECHQWQEIHVFHTLYYPAPVVYKDIHYFYPVCLILTPVCFRFSFRVQIKPDKLFFHATTFKYMKLAIMSLLSLLFPWKTTLRSHHFPSTPYPVWSPLDVFQFANIVFVC